MAYIDHFHSPAFATERAPRLRSFRDFFNSLLNRNNAELATIRVVLTDHVDACNHAVLTMKFPDWTSC